MTSPSPRKRRTTRPSILPWTFTEAVALAVVVALGGRGVGAADFPNLEWHYAPQAEADAHPATAQSTPPRQPRVWNTPVSDESALGAMPAGDTEEQLLGQSTDRVASSALESRIETGHYSPIRRRPMLRSGSEIWMQMQSKRPPAEIAAESQEAPALEPSAGESDGAAATPPQSGPEGDNFQAPLGGEDPSTQNPAGPPEVGLPDDYDQPRQDAGPSEPARSPQQLKRLTEIMPYYDYEPDPAVRAEDPCRNLCPRPDGAPCKSYEEGEAVPACPEEVGLGQEEFRDRDLAPSTFAWAASNLYHYPLYFEDPALERYGHTHGCLLQPFVSTGRFSAQLIGLPYQMAIDPICKKRYTLGWYRPGECAPKLHYQVPWNTHAAAVQAGVMTGLFYAFP